MLLISFHSSYRIQTGAFFLFPYAAEIGSGSKIVSVRMGGAKAGHVTRTTTTWAPRKWLLAYFDGAISDE